jgi:hypothetical protein
MCFPAINRYRGNTCAIFEMINMIAGEHIPETIELNNVYARYRLDSGQTSPAIFRPLKLVNQKFVKQDSGGTSTAIELIAEKYITVSNFRRRWPHGPVRTHEKLFSRSKTFYVV